MFVCFHIIRCQQVSWQAHDCQQVYECVSLHHELLAVAHAPTYKSTLARSDYLTKRSWEIWLPSGEGESVYTTWRELGVGREAGQRSNIFGQENWYSLITAVCWTTDQRQSTGSHSQYSTVTPYHEVHPHPLLRQSTCSRWATDNSGRWVKTVRVIRHHVFRFWIHSAAPRLRTVHQMLLSAVRMNNSSLIYFIVFHKFQQFKSWYFQMNNAG